MRVVIGVVVASLIGLTGVAGADEGAVADGTGPSLETKWDERQWTVSMNVGFVSLGQLGVSVERSLVRRFAIAVGTGIDFLRGYPYGAETTTRYAVAGRVRYPLVWGAVGVSLNASVGEEKIKIDHATYDDVHNALTLGANAYFERRWDNGFTWRFMIGWGSMVTYTDCDGRCREEDLEPEVFFSTLGFTLGWSF